jgi:hypothetical protein
MKIAYDMAGDQFEQQDKRRRTSVRRSIVLLGALVLILVAGQAGAKTLDWHGTLDLDLGPLKTFRTRGSGVATVNNSSGGNHLDIMRLAGGITGSGTIPVTDPNTTATIQSIRISATLGTGTLSGISGAPPLNPPAKLPVPGFTRICLLTTGCGTSLVLNNTTNNGNTGIGVGGLLTIGRFGSVRFSIVNVPWTLATVSGISQTNLGNFKIVSDVGWVHGAASSNSSTAAPSGAIQLIAPQQVSTTGISGNSSELTLFARLTLHFIPEPGLLLLLGANLAALVAIGRKRMKP